MPEATIQGTEAMNLPRAVAAMHSPARARPAWRTYLPLAVALACMAALLACFWPWTSDDAFISFRYARNLAQGHGLVFNPGEPVEGYSNLAFTLWLAAASWLGLDIVAVAKLLGVAGLGAVVALSAALAARLGGRRAALVTLLLCLTSPVLAYWAVSGMETLPYAALVLLAGWLYLRYREGRAGPVAVGLAFLAVALMRAEGAAFFAATCAFHVAGLVRRRPGCARDEENVTAASLWPDLAAAAVFAVPYLAYLAWRGAFYGSLVPNTVVAKTGYGEQLRAGLSYLAAFLPVSFTLLYLGLRPYAHRRAMPAAQAYLWCLCALWALLVVLFGGDWMLLHRFFVPVLPLLYILAGAGLSHLVAAQLSAHGGSAAGPGRRRSLLAILACALVLNVAPCLWPVRPEAFLSGLSWDEATSDVGFWLRANAAPGERVALYDAGRVAYYSGLQVVDCVGLVTPAVARLPGRFERKEGVAPYVLAQRPEYVELNAFGAMQGDTFTPETVEGFFAEPEFRERYRLVLWRDAWVTRPGVRYVLLYQRADLP